MGEVEAKDDRVERHALRHDRHTVSMLTDHLVFSPKYHGKVLLGEVGEAAEENLSLEKKTLPKKHEWEVVEKYISGQKVSYSYEKTDTVPVVVIDEEEEKSFKTGYITLYTNFFRVTGSVS